ncbi:UvrD-helicase domain-containing protein [Rhabdochlamydiaceae symbiont of Dictyostelium giganteum]|uniref:UvrD-helicase domain-containing protein n=1 Tax=Rhabdochlamydiaceae symbiont of Dictyostelium giganteum TaxID=3342349 RepID=UPI0038513CDD
MNFFDILAKETPIPSRLFLEASAGTGKTFTIEHLFIRLLLEKKFSIHEIVVVTFTKAATRELKERIRCNLALIVEGKKSYPYLEQLSPQQRSALQEALNQFDTAQIFTIHSFCHHLLQQFALETNTSFHLSEWEPHEKEWEMKEFLRTQNTLSSGQLRKLLRSLANDITTLMEKLGASSSQEQKCPSSKELLEEVNTCLLEITPFPVEKEFEALKVHYKKMNSKQFSSQARQLETALQEQKIPLDLWEEWITAPDFFLENLHRDQIKVKGSPPQDHPLFHLRKHIVPRLQLAQNRLNILKTLQMSWREHEQQVAEEKGKITPDDLLQKVYEALKSSEFIESIRKCYQSIIIDEFQDTDPLQWAIFQTLFLQDPSKRAYFIGDPKQSIYGFRKADIYTFLEASNHFAVESKAILHRNFRSGSSLISQLNHLFCHPGWMHLPRHNTHLEIHPSTAAVEGEGELIFMIMEEEKTRSSKWPSLKTEEDLLFPFIVETLQKLALKPQQVAILVKDRYQARRVQNFLTLWNIPSALGKKAPLKESLAFTWLEELGELFLDPHSTSSLTKLLLGPFAQLLPHEITGEALFKAKQHILQLKEVWLQKGFGACFALFLRLRLGKDTALSCCYSSGQHLPYEDLLELIPHLFFSPTPHHFKTSLRKLKQEGSEDRLKPSSQGVQIMTVHASKGLEFDTVFAIGLASRTPYQDLSPLELEELDAEKMRQFYVALTRAKTRVYIPIVHEIPTPSYGLGEGSPVEIFLSRRELSLNAFSCVHLKEGSFSLTPPSLEEIPIIPPNPMPEPLAVKPLYSFSSLAHYEKQDVEVTPDGLTAGLETGHVIHRILERYFNQEDALLNLIRQEIIHTSLASQEEKIHALLEKTLGLNLDGFTLLDINLETLQTEMEFLYPSGKGWMKGFIDLCFLHNQKVYIIDWKSNQIPQNSFHALQDVMQSHDYLLQGKIYEEALQRYLRHYPDLTLGGIYFIFIRGPFVYSYTS